MGYDRDQYRTLQIQDYISMFYPELQKEFRDCTVLDMGCGTGTVALSMAPYAKSVLGVDIDDHLLDLARKEADRTGIENVSFINLSAYDFRSSDSFDVVILSDVLEHVPDQEALLKQCLGFLAPQGVMYMNTPNKWFPMEPHKHLPFLSYLPRRLADQYSRAFSRGSYESYRLLSYGQFTDLLGSFPIRYIFKTQPNPKRPLYRLANPLVEKAPFLWRFSNAFQVIIQHR